MRADVFIDSGAFIAYLVRADRLHGEVAELFQGPAPIWSTSTLVVAETYSWFLHRHGEDAARLFRGLLDDLPGMQVFDPDAAHRRQVWSVLDALRGQRLTFVDASSLVWIEGKRIPVVWGADHHLGLQGATVVPGPPAASGRRRRG
ncbi:MAG: type II toxin-antitoxin system VapC family toxin [Thermoanaerobaculales bacterium]